MTKFLPKHLFAAGTSLALMLALGVGLAFADSVATNGGATNVSDTSATLNGTVAPTSADSEWTFQYGTNSSYGKTTKVTPIGAGSKQVSATVTGLSPNTTYHFRLVVAENVSNSIPDVHTSGDLAFQTSGNSGGGGGGGKGGGGSGGGGGSTGKFGKASLGSSTLKVSGGSVTIPFKCAGQKGTACKGTLSLSARGKLSGTTKTVGCGSTKFSLSGGQSRKLKVRIARSCKTLLMGAKHHRLRAKLKATFTTHQATLNRTVTLAG